MGRIIRGNRSRQETPEQIQDRLRQTLRMNLGYKESSDMPEEQLLDTPQWFTNNSACDISIIVPMFKSRQCIEEQIASWTDDGLKAEIIYADDLCPTGSYKTIIPSWEKRNPQSPIGKIVLSNIHRGYGGNCNLGAQHAIGTYLVFLNADATVQEGWLRPMYDLCRSDPQIGIVGNLQIKKGSINNTIESAGSVWNSKNNWFDHIGRDVYNGTRLTAPMPLADAPADLLCVSERQMVTGCCFMIPRSLFEEIGGYDLGYKIGYWEDSDMNMKVHKLGKRVMYQPKSKIFHVGGHSNASNHRYMLHNRKLFYSRWLGTGFIQELVSEIPNG